MSRPAKITLLCEDRQHACFVRRFFMNRGWARHDIYEQVGPAGKGSGEKWVRDRFPKELKAYRSQANHLRNGLVAVIDADTQEVADRIRGFDLTCDEQGVARALPEEERVLFVVPKRNIETWLAYLRGEEVDETRPYSRYDFESRCHQDADKLEEMCKSGQQLPGEPPPSLKRCCIAFDEFWRLIR